MSQKTKYRMGCFLFGFVVGVIYFASPYANPSLADADGLNSQDLQQIDQREDQAITTVQTDLSALQAEENKLEEIEAKIIAELSEPNQGAPANIVEPRIPETLNSKQIQELNVIVDELDSEQRLVDEQNVASIQNEEVVTERAQLKAKEIIVPAKITRKAFFVEREGAPMKEGHIEIGGALLPPGSDWQAIIFESEKQALSRVKYRSSAKKIAKAPKTKQQPEIAQVSSGSMNLLKRENVELKEEVLSLKLLMHTLQDEEDLAMLKPTSSIATPQVAYGTRTAADEKIANEVLPARLATTAEQAYQDEYEFDGKIPGEASGVEPGDPALVRFDRTPLRLGPGTNFTRVAVLPRGTVLKVDYYRGGWFRVYTREGVRAWIAEDALEWF